MNPFPEQSKCKNLHVKLWPITLLFQKCLSYLSFLVLPVTVRPNSPPRCQKFITFNCLTSDIKVHTWLCKHTHKLLFMYVTVILSGAIYASLWGSQTTVMSEKLYRSGHTNCQKPGCKQFSTCKLMQWNCVRFNYQIMFSSFVCP